MKKQNKEQNVVEEKIEYQLLVQGHKLKVSKQKQKKKQNDENGTKREKERMKKRNVSIRQLVPAVIKSHPSH